MAASVVPVFALFTVLQHVHSPLVDLSGRSADSVISARKSWSWMFVPGSSDDVDATAVAPA
jgi:hypothetical protein